MPAPNPANPYHCDAWGDRNEVDRARLIAKDASDLSWEDIHRMRAELIAKNPSAGAEYAYKNMFPHILKREYDNAFTKKCLNHAPNIDK